MGSTKKKKNIEKGFSTFTYRVVHRHILKYRCDQAGRETAIGGRYDIDSACVCRTGRRMLAYVQTNIPYTQRRHAGALGVSAELGGNSYSSRINYSMGEARTRKLVWLADQPQGCHRPRPGGLPTAPARRRLRWRRAVLHVSAPAEFLLLERRRGRARAPNPRGKPNVGFTPIQSQTRVGPALADPTRSATPFSVCLPAKAPFDR